MPSTTPHYPLEQVQELARAGMVRITAVAFEGAFELGLQDEIVPVILALTPADCAKTMPDRRFPGEYQDVYKPEYRDMDLYIKLKIKDGRQLVVEIVSFKAR